MTGPALAARSLHAGHGRVPVVRDLDLEVASGEMVAILGPNGAGKTTLMLTLAGLLPPISGSVELFGEVLPARQPHVAARRGLSLVSDDRALFSGMTVAENLEVARGRHGMSVADVLDVFPRLGSRIGVNAGMISGGEQQMLALARGMIQQPRVLLVDEMSAGLAPLIVRDLFQTLRQAADATGVAVVLVEQHVDLALDHADRALVLVHGEVALAGSTEEIRADRSRLEAAYLNRPLGSTSVSSTST